MAKNKLLIDQMKRYQKQVDEIIPKLYSVFALSLKEKYNWDADQITELFEDTQDRWQEYADNGINIVELCFEKADLDIRCKKEDK